MATRRDRKQISPPPADVQVKLQAREPVTDPTLGIRVTVNKSSTPPHRLVTLGDSLTQGFQSGAIFNTQISYPAIIAHEMGWAGLRYPRYNDAPGGGIPLNLELAVRELDQRFGDKINALEFTPALLFLRNYLDNIEDYWERGEGSRFPITKLINHNLAVYGWDVRNTISRNADICLQVLKDNPPRDNFVREVVSHHNERGAIRVLNSARSTNGAALSPVEAAQALGAEGIDGTDGIETLIVMIGANNALGSILTFNVVWSDTGYSNMEINDKYTVWRPIHFQAELDKLVEQIKKVRARHVILSTVPHVTIAPLARGVNHKMKDGSRYFPYYTLPWIKDDDFNPNKHPYLTGEEARAIDSAIDQYNDSITAAVRQARLEGRDWYVFEEAGLLDRLASRRYILDPKARPSWWTPYELPVELQQLNPVPDSRFFQSGPNGRTQGGLFSLDGIHPSTIGYGIVAQEIIKIMQLAGVKFYQGDGKTEKTGKIKVDFNRLIELDTLVTNPPGLVTNVLDIVGWIDKNFNIFSNLLRSSY